ncbi:MAG: hypothetical protein J3T61_11310, partial [Candidatus Brocadiales bacterium]|nr:hypothetical protein [Candidatus Bathyanammoxibius sp.]
MNKAYLKGPTIPWTAIPRLGAAAAGALLLAFVGCEIVNFPPRIDISIPEEALTGSKQTFTAVVEDRDEDAVLIDWSAENEQGNAAGEFYKTTGEEVDWIAPADIGKVIVTAIADDRKAGGTDTAKAILSVVNSAPGITEFSSSTPYITLGNSVTLSCEAFDPYENIIFEFYTSPSGVGAMFQESPEANTATWTAPSDPNLARSYDLIVKVSDVPQGYYSTDTLQVLVFSEYGTIWVVDSGHSRVSKYTSRGKAVLSAAYTFLKPVAVVNNIDEFYGYGCYVADHDAGRIVKLDEKGRDVQSFSSIPDIPNVIDLAIHRYTGTLWAISVSKNEPRLTVIDTYTESTIKQIKGLHHPVAIVINQNRGDVWISDYGEADRVIQINIRDFLIDLPDSLSSLNATIFEGNFNNPSSLSVRDAADAT